MSDFRQVMEFWREGHQPQAEAALAALLARDPDHHDGLRFLAELRSSQGRATEEMQALRHLVELCPPRKPGRHPGSALAGRTLVVHARPGWGLSTPGSR